jgi:hypothetical protein
MIVKVDNIRAAWKKAKRAHSKVWVLENKMSDASKYWADLGNYYNIKVNIDGYMMGFARIATIEFKDEESYAWFMLRWS